MVLFENGSMTSTRSDHDFPSRPALAINWIIFFNNHEGGVPQPAEVDHPPPPNFSATENKPVLCGCKIQMFCRQTKFGLNRICLPRDFGFKIQMFCRQNNFGQIPGQLFLAEDYKCIGAKKLRHKRFLVNLTQNVKYKCFASKRFLAWNFSAPDPK